MVDITKLDMTNIWASGGDKVTPSAEKIAQGWVVEAVPRQTWNWFENRQDQNIAYLLQKGFPEWDSTTEYVASKSWVNRSGTVYKAIATGTAQDPASAPTYWVKAFPESSAALEALRVLTPAANMIPFYTSGSAAAQFLSTAYGRGFVNSADALAARTYISAQEADATLTALAGVAATTNKLPYFNGTDSATVTDLTAFGRSLIDDADATAGRATLGLGTSATVDATTSNLDVTAGRLMRVGDFGLGAPTANVNVDDVTLPSGTYSVSGAGAGTYPAGFGSGTVTVSSRNVSPYRATQLLVSDVNGRIHTRYNSGTWSAWVRATLDSDITATNRDTTVGKIMKVGDFGLGFAASLGAGVDLDTVVDSGFYRLAGDNVNMPTGAAYGQMIVSRGGDTISQTIVNYTGPRMWVRGGNPVNTGGVGVWTAWVEQYHTGNITKVATDLGLNAAATAPVTGAGNAVMSQSPTFQGTPLAPTASPGTSTTQLATTQFVLQNASANPSGTIIAYAGTVVPAGYLLANGALLNRTTYSALFAAIGTTYGAGDGSTTFAIPELRGEFLRGLDNGRGVDTSRVLGSAQAAQMQSHAHTFVGNYYGGHGHSGTTDQRDHYHNFSGGTAGEGQHTHHVNRAQNSSVGSQTNRVTTANGDSGQAADAAAAAGWHGHSFSGTTDWQGHAHNYWTSQDGAFTPTGSITASGGTANGSETRPRNVAVQFVIKY
ncbi:putative tail fiber protein [Pseudomonas phage phiK7A1]|uniref:Putative tail fiber protein n=1 Tax=Pseudomonas phage phiK7A1 TaxID=2759194 RepID=A0A7H0XFT6_9CAUD|nr:putative tail fiber protein [Pseudomonas phage phiK7A1]